MPNQLRVPLRPGWGALLTDPPLTTAFHTLTFQGAQWHAAPATGKKSVVSCTTAVIQKLINARGLRSHYKCHTVVLFCPALM